MTFEARVQVFALAIFVLAFIVGPIVAILYLQG